MKDATRHVQPDINGGKSAVITFRLMKVEVIHDVQANASKLFKYVRFHQKDTLKRFFERFEQNGLTINRFRADCGSCSEEIVEVIEKHCKSFYILANRCSSIYNDTFALKGWKTEEINGIEFELNSILVEKWKGKAYRLAIQRQKRMDGVQDFWEGEYTYRCILTNDYDSSVREIVEFYNLRGEKERFR